MHVKLVEGRSWKAQEALKLQEYADESLARPLTIPLIVFVLASASLHAQSNHVKGLTTSQAAELFAKWGKNELPENKRHPFLIFLSYFWGPM